jgi:uncharacterized protein
MTDNSARVRSLYESFGRGDLKSILEHLDPSIDWISSTSASVIPMGWPAQRSRRRGLFL